MLGCSGGGRRMCYLSEWPKSFLKAVIRHYSNHQVRMGFFQTRELTLALPPGHR